ncbi:hypothetical protein H1R17_05835 [Flavobacterium sp. xlx-214]|uniref:hypothetical protein n=1 Tax=unclassified Flavobacterium TaxID=196869 RepID=UPI0013D7FCCF|nr:MULTISPECIES: hypothetical protein [unclassified Flavobacterium]MBA5793028.1 hypothetical protein [Flavobacterium sp. xlx-221]QMI84644.1 hypothetical protein H1R17_05835 [Flavobacterium sp. xlx-214]
MKKIKNLTLGILGATILSVGLYACSNDNEATTSNNTTTEQSTIAAKEALDENLTTIYSNLTKKAFGTYLIQNGVLDVKIKEEIDNGFIFTFETEKNFGFSTQSFNLANYNFKISNNKLSLNNYSIQKVKSEYIFYKNNNVIEVENKDEILKDFDFIILGIVYDELSKDSLITYQEHIKNYSNQSSSSTVPCPWWNTKTITGIGWTSGSAKSDLHFATIQNANEGDLVGCRSLGGVEVNSKLDGLYFTAVQSFCCP